MGQDITDQAHIVSSDELDATLDLYQQWRLCTLYPLSNAPAKIRVKVTSPYLIHDWLSSIQDDARRRQLHLEFMDRVVDPVEIDEWILYFPEDTEIMFERLLDTKNLFKLTIEPFIMQLQTRTATGVEDFLDRMIGPWHVVVWLRVAPSDYVILENRFPEFFSKEK